MLQDDEADGPYYRQEWEGMKQTTPIISGGNALFRDPMPDPHTNGSPLPDPPKGFVNSSGALADGTAMGKVGNDIVHWDAAILYSFSFQDQTLNFVHAVL